MKNGRKTLRRLMISFMFVAIIAMTGCATKIVKPPRSAPEIAAPATPEKSRDMVFINRPPPYYPRIAAEQKLEGWVAFQYDVDTQGKLKNIVLLDSSPPKIFDRAAERAIIQYRFRPYIEDGEAIEVKGLSAILHFKMGK